MFSFETNKVLGGLFMTLLGVQVLNITAHAIFAPGKLERPGYVVTLPDEAASYESAKPVPVEPLPLRLARSDPQRGESTARQCVACHSFERGGPHRVGPNLWGIVGRAKADVTSFNYSAALKAKSGSWTLDNLDLFIADPKGFVPGTTMNYAGLKRADQRADLLNYLRTLANNPLPLPRAGMRDALK